MWGGRNQGTLRGEGIEVCVGWKGPIIADRDGRVLLEERVFRGVWGFIHLQTKKEGYVRESERVLRPYSVDDKGRARLC